MRSWRARKKETEVSKMYKRNSREENKEVNESTEEKRIKEAASIGKKKWVRYKEGAVLYSMGIHTFMDLAKEAKAVYHIKRIVLVNTEKLDEYIELMCADDPEDI